MSRSIDDRRDITSDPVIDIDPAPAAKGKQRETRQNQKPVNATGRYMIYVQVIKYVIYQFLNNGFETGACIPFL